MNLFIIRPFGVKTIFKKKADNAVNSVEMNFDDVDTQLIRPALAMLGIQGGTTGDIFASGSIKADMFSLLLTADIVIADISIHNANVYYELGVRHALRNHVTILIKTPGLDDVPFDIHGFRYLNYDKSDPGKEVDNLARMIHESVESVKTDSPVFEMIPTLEAQNPENFFAIDESFANEMEVAAGARELGILKLLAEESKLNPWCRQAEREIGNKLFDLKQFEWSMAMFEDVLERAPGDLESNLKLATIYQRLANFNKNPQQARSYIERSNICISKILDQRHKLKSEKIAEAFALQGRNEKARWIGAWSNIPDELEKQKSALRSSHLSDALANYEAAFLYSLNHFYSGINALGLLHIVVGLAERLPDEWNSMFESDEDAGTKLKVYKERIVDFSAALRLSLDSDKKVIDDIPDQRDKADRKIWHQITRADLAFLTVQSPERAVQKYREAFAGALDFHKESVDQQLRIFLNLDIRKSFVEQVLNSFTFKLAGNQKKHVVLFTGHMIDAAGRKSPRFPQSNELKVKEMIRKELQQIKDSVNIDLVGIAGGSCGGDILFHEVCDELQISSEVYLLLPEQLYKQQSVSFAGNNWIQRFDILVTSKNTHLLQDTLELPDWTDDITDYSPWVRNNLWLLWSAASGGWQDLTLVALWDGQDGDGPGGTKHLVDVVQSRGGRTVIIDPPAV
ncbi:MAG: tetratricopeptide repeat-containing protein [Flavobacteriales bacterium]